MKTRSMAALASLAGDAIGAVAVQGLHAQTKARSTSSPQTDITDLDAYQKENVRLFRPRSRRRRSPHRRRQISLRWKGCAGYARRHHQFDSLSAVKACAHPQIIRPRGRSATKTRNSDLRHRGPPSLAGTGSFTLESGAAHMLSIERFVAPAIWMPTFAGMTAETMSASHYQRERGVLGVEKAISLLLGLSRESSRSTSSGRPCGARFVGMERAIVPVRVQQPEAKPRPDRRHREIHVLEPLFRPDEAKARDPRPIMLRRMQWPRSEGRRGAQAVALAVDAADPRPAGKRGGKGDRLFENGKFLRSYERALKARLDSGMNLDLTRLGLRSSGPPNALKQRPVRMR